MQPMLKWMLFVLNMNGLDPRNRSFVAMIKRWFTLFTSLFFTGLIIVGGMQFKGFEILGKLDQLPVNIMFPTRMICLMVRHELLLKIINRATSFWSTEKYGKDFEKILLKIHGEAFKYSNIFWVMCLGTGLVLAMKPLLTETPSLMFEGYAICDLSSSTCFGLINTWQFVMTYTQYLPVVLSYDGLYLNFMAYAIAGIEMIKESLRRMITYENIGDETMKNEIAEMVEEHNNILEFIRDVKIFFSEQLLVVFWTSTGSLIFALYMITSTGFPPDPSIISRYGLMSMAVCTELLLYSIAGTILMDQTLSVAEEAYAVDWYMKTQPNVRRSLSLIILRSQKAEILRIGNMADLNLAAFLSVLRNASSVLTLLRTIETK